MNIISIEGGSTRERENLFRALQLSVEKDGTLLSQYKRENPFSDYYFFVEPPLHQINSDYESGERREILNHQKTQLSSFVRDFKSLEFPPDSARLHMVTLFSPFTTYSLAKSFLSEKTLSELCEQLVKFHRISIYLDRGEDFYRSVRLDFLLLGSRTTMNYKDLGLVNESGQLAKAILYYITFLLILTKEEREMEERFFQLLYRKDRSYGRIVYLRFGKEASKNFWVRDFSFPITLHCQTTEFSE